MGFNFTKRPFFNKYGEWHIPKDIPWGGQLNPKLKPSEYNCWLLLNSDNVPEDAWTNLVGSRVTVWRIKKSLKQKGYL